MKVAARAGLLIHRLMPAAAVGTSAILFLIGTSYVPWPCPTRVLFQIPCPTCGLTRATRAVLAGNFHEATAMHPLWFVVLPALAAFMAAEFGGYMWTGRWGSAARALPPRAGGRITTAILTALLIVWIARFFGAFGGPVPG